MEVNNQSFQSNEMLESLRNGSYQKSKSGIQNEKICPFRGIAENPCYCSPDCKLYRADKKSYECVFQELQAISWFLNPRRKY